MAVKTVPVLMLAKHIMSKIKNMIKVVTCFICMMHVHMLHVFGLRMYSDEASGIGYGFMTTCFPLKSSSVS